MTIQPLTLLEPTGFITPLVLDSPHSGRVYPDDFDYVCPFPFLRQTEDSYVDELIAGATEVGATILVAEFPRSYIDVNRAENDIDPAVLTDTWPAPLESSERTLLGLGLVRRLCKSGVPVYKKQLSIKQVENRIKNYYRPYHAALEKILKQRHAHFGECYLINCHSMPDRSSENRLAQRPDFVVGDRNGTSCDTSFTHRVTETLRDMGYHVAVNDPYKGVEIVRRYGQPRRGRHALQLEMNRRLYMDEQTLEKHNGFLELQRNLKKFFGIVTDSIMSDDQRLAAE